jgi:hypothetical protein
LGARARRAGARGLADARERGGPAHPQSPRSPLSATRSCGPTSGSPARMSPGRRSVRPHPSPPPPACRPPGPAAAPGRPAAARWGPPRPLLACRLGRQPPHPSAKGAVRRAHDPQLAIPSPTPTPHAPRPDFEFINGNPATEPGTVWLHSYHRGVSQAEHAFAPSNASRLLAAGGAPAAAADGLRTFAIDWQPGFVSWCVAACPAPALCRGACPG